MVARRVERTIAAGKKEEILALGPKKYPGGGAGFEVRSQRLVSSVYAVFTFYCTSSCTTF